MLNGQLKLHPILPDEVCQAIQRINESYQDSAYGFELLIKEELLHCFRLMVQSATPTTSPTINSKNRFRIQRSSQLLLQTDKSITEIAHLCGFNHSSYFNRLFLKYMGCCPSEYKKNHKDN